MTEILGREHEASSGAGADALIAEAGRRAPDRASYDGMLSLLLGITHDDGSNAAELREEMVTMFLAGIESTAPGLAWAFSYLSRDHAARDRLVAEIDTIVGRTDEMIKSSGYLVSPVEIQEAALAAVHPATHTEAAVGCPLPVTLLAEHPTVRLLHAEIGALTRGRPQ